MIKYRTISHLLQIFVLPEVEKRIKSGQIKDNGLPIELYQFRAIQRKLPDGKILPIVELNEELKLITRVKAKRAVSAGESLGLNDIYPEECFISPPVYDGKHAAYFLCQRMLFDYFLYFDCRPNLPDISEKELEESKGRYPILDFINAKNFKEIVKPEEKIKILADANWPPAPGYYPSVLVALHNDPNSIMQSDFVKAVSAAYAKPYWDQRIIFWEDTNFFPERAQYLKRAIDAHFNKDYIASIYVLVPQFEGIIKDYLESHGVTPTGGFQGYVDQLKGLVFSRKILMFPKNILDTIFDYLKTGSFWMKDSGSVHDPKSMVNRHGIAHGVFKGFECEGISLKYLIMLDALSFILLHDKMLTRSI